MKLRHIVLLSTLALGAAVACGGGDSGNSGGDGDGDGDSPGDGDGDSGGDGDAAGDGDGDGSGGSLGEGGAPVSGGTTGDGDGDATGGMASDGGAGGEAASGGSDGGTDQAECKRLDGELSDALGRAQMCSTTMKPPGKEEYCASPVETTCGCEVPVGLSTSKATLVYKELLAEYKKRECVKLCPAVLCSKFEPGIYGEKTGTCSSARRAID